MSHASKLISKTLLVGAAVAALGAGCAPQSAPVTPPVSPPKAAASVSATASAPVQNDLLPNPDTVDVDADFTVGSQYMRETPQRYDDLKGKKPFLLYFYADWDKDERAQHPELVKLFDGNKMGTAMLRVNFKDNQVTDEGVAWANALKVEAGDTVIAFDASGKEVARFTGKLDEAKLVELMAKANLK